MLNGWQKVSALILSSLLLLAAIAFSAALPKLASSVGVIVCIPLAILCMSKESRKKQTLWYAAGIFVICVPLVGNALDAPQLLAAMGRFSPVMALLVGVSLFRHSLTRSGLAALVSSRLITPPAGARNSVRVALATMALTLFTSQGAISMMGAVCGPQVKNRLGIARITMRALCASMFVLPTTVASASIAAAIPHLDTAAVLLLGMPLALFVVAGAMTPHLELDDGPGKAREVDKLKPIVLAAMVTAFGVICYVATNKLTWSFAFAMVSGYAFELLVLSGGKAAQTLAKEAPKSIDGIAPELLLLAASSLLIFTIQHIDLAAYLPQAARAPLANPYAIGVLLIGVLPAITMLGVHPMILFGIFFPLVDATALGPTYVQYLAWTSMFVMSNLLSPVSICSILAATSLQMSSRDTSFVSNWRFCALGMAIAYVYVLALLKFLPHG
ncbi:hypothetical protein WT67_34055 [Burkholderia stagnalis]|uniref:Uncharacterized protein n=1 Tax=Burkholderia stagnalis TaxID=1503054 RepID=A0A119RX46_9BURK|nr:hypothetical protein [Burkholderia stagnalis]AOK51928.1 hypothetical protein WT74_03845 [Burkholderia stagnalis]KAB0636228.1 hypothetical protein F7R25_20440 [Burkholderia stagnalis]KVD86235.1 hypothetical protein WS63_20715 [Burkholderia stagnalis]KVL88355.1 hypothetical protein WT02_25835 [Burkholderia stagnalis]KVL99432.1 hypothetical protein WT03_07425 [Burkholderia stagnalis]